MIGNVTSFWRLTRELDLNAIREDFERLAALRVLGTSLDLAERVARLIDPEALGSEVQAGTLAAWQASGRERRAAPDVYVIALEGTINQAERRALTELGIGEVPLLLVQAGTQGDVVVLGVPEERIVRVEATEPDDTWRERLMGTLVNVAPETMLPLGRRYPHAREAVAQHLIRDTARVNAHFAALSSIPATIPLLGGFVGDMADVLVLTKNQVTLVFKLAGLYGRDLSLGRELIQEVLPVVGGAFFWRSTARALVGLLPAFISVLPKAVVAYSGTFLVGELARSYYRSGRKPSPAMARDLQAESMKLAREFVTRLRR